MQILTPGMQHGEEADGGPEQPRLGGRVEPRLGGAAEQDGVNRSRVLKGQSSDLRGKREDHVEIGHGQKL